jgi:hypothetical protein
MIADTALLVGEQEKDEASTVKRAHELPQNERFNGWDRAVGGYIRRRLRHRSSCARAGVGRMSVGGGAGERRGIYIH